MCNYFNNKNTSAIPANIDIMEHCGKTTVEKQVFFTDEISENDKVVTKFVILSMPAIKGFVTKL